MSDLSLFLSGFALVYSVVAVEWFLVFFWDWYKLRRNTYGVVSDRVQVARLALLAPIWLPFLMFVAGHLVAERWRPASVGRLIGDFALDVKGRSDDE